MTFPLFSHGDFGHWTGLLVGTLVGIGFGFSLERAGFGRARNLVAQFYLTDLRVLKVMFSAIVTALCGMALLGGLGVLDLSLITVPPTFLWPQLVGGLMLGVGFVVSGYCPGTAVVAAGSGNLDGIVALSGMLGGSLVFGFLFPALKSFYDRGAMGSVRWSDSLGVPFAAATAAVAAMAIGAFVGGEKVERIFAGRAGEAPPPSPTPVRRRVFAGFAIASAVALAALALPARPREARPSPVARVEIFELARQLVVAPEDVWLLDVRSPEAASSGAIPGAIRLPEGTSMASFVAGLPPTRRLVLYGEGELAALPEGARGFAGSVAVLSGGYAAWEREILAAPVLPPNPTPALVADFRLRSALRSRLTGGAAAPAPPIETRAAPAAAASGPKKGGGC